MIRFIVTFLFFIQSEESYMILHDPDLFYDNYNTWYPLWSDLKSFSITSSAFSLSIYLFIYLFIYLSAFYKYIILKIHQLNVIKIIKKDYKKELVKDIKVFLKKKKNNANIWLSTIQKSTRKWKTKAGWV